MTPRDIQSVGFLQGSLDLGLVILAIIVCEIIIIGAESERWN